MKPRQLRLAAVQMVSANGRVAENLARAGQWAEQAARQGAELVLLPELFAIGFELNAHAWSSAEPQGGPIGTLRFSFSHYLTHWAQLPICRT